MNNNWIISFRNQQANIIDIRAGYAMLLLLLLWCNTDYVIISLCFYHLIFTYSIIYLQYNSCSIFYSEKMRKLNGNKELSGEGNLFNLSFPLIPLFLFFITLYHSFSLFFYSLSLFFTLFQHYSLFITLIYHYSLFLI